jgi:glycosyltransferase involved in cell wall biosynthesis
VKHSIIHLVEDCADDRITDGLDFLAAKSADSSHHQVVRVRRGQLSAPKVTADVIVSHLSVCWTNLPLFTALRAVYPSTPLVHVEHRHGERFVALNVKRARRFETLTRSAMAIFDHVVAVSAGQAQWMRRKAYGHGDHISVLSACADLGIFLDVLPRVSGAPRVIGAIGALETQQGFDILVQAFQDPRLAQLELHIHGAGSQRDALKAMAKGQDNVVFKGSVVDPAAALAACDVVAMPSRWDADGMSALEAMAASRPVVCSHTDGAEAHIRAGAIEVGCNTPQSWADILSRLSSFDLSGAKARGRSYAQDCKKRHLQAWTDLIDEGVVEGTEDEKLAA